ncbi:MAG: Alanine racemase [Promethearchaeota archaeon]|nr:MAG: Alanine racemase [Candidatus Lokiarchaeota archaeon]
MEQNWKEQIPTPALVLNYDQMVKNMEYMADFVKKNNVNLRQHVKTAKIPLVAHIQQKIAGENAKGIAVAKVGEAEIYAQAGFDDILIANQVINPSHIERMVLLNKYIDIRCCVDSKKNIDDINRIASKYNSTLELLIDVDLGMGRTGVKPGEPALDLANYIREKSHLKLVGLQGYEGHLTPQTDHDLRKEQTEACMKDLVDTRDLINDNGFDISWLSASGSGTFMFSAEYPGITEVQPGTYVFSDEHVYRVVEDFIPAVTVLGTISNKMGKRLYTMDAGTKAFPTGDGRPEFKGHPKCRFRVVTEEHSQFKAGTKDDFEIGDKIELIPAHICITVNIYDHIHVVKSGEYVGKWKILARGKNY